MEINIVQKATPPLPPGLGVRGRTSSELAQEAQIIFQIESQVVYAGLYHMGAFDAKTESKAAVTFGVDAVRLQNIGMDKASAAEFQSSAPPGNRVVNPRFDKRKKIGTKAHKGLAAKHLTSEGCESAFEVRHRDMLVHHEDIYLMKCVMMGGIHSLVAEATPYSGNPKRRLAFRHDTPL